VLRRRIHALIAVLLVAAASRISAAAAPRQPFQRTALRRIRVVVLTVVVVAAARTVTDRVLVTMAVVAAADTLIQLLEVLVIPLQQLLNPRLFRLLWKSRRQLLSPRQRLRLQHQLHSSAQAHCAAAVTSQIACLPV
jgi:hypothetical protein